MPIILLTNDRPLGRGCSVGPPTKGGGGYAFTPVKIALHHLAPKAGAVGPAFKAIQRGVNLLTISQ